MAKFNIKNPEILVTRDTESSANKKYYLIGVLEDPKNKFQNSQRRFTCFSESVVQKVREHLPVSKNGLIPDADYAATKATHEAFLENYLVLANASIEEVPLNATGEGILKWFVSLSPTTATRNAMTTKKFDDLVVNSTKAGKVVVKDKIHVTCQYRYVMVADPNNPQFDADGELIENKLLVDENGRPVTKWQDGMDPITQMEQQKRNLWMPVLEFIQKTNGAGKQALPIEIQALLEPAAESVQPETTEPPTSEVGGTASAF